MVTITAQKGTTWQRGQHGKELCWSSLREEGLKRKKFIMPGKAWRREGLAIVVLVWLLAYMRGTHRSQEARHEGVFYRYPIPPSMSYL